MEPEPTLVKIDPKDQQFKFLFLLEKVVLGVGLLVGFYFLGHAIPALATQINPLMELVCSGVISHALIDIYGKRKFDRMVKDSTVTDDSETDSTD